MAGVSEFKTILNNDTSKSNYNRIRDVEIIDKAFKLDESLGNDDLVFATPEEREKYYSMEPNRRFRITENDLLEFNQWIKSKMPQGQKPRLLSQFKSENDYEEFMINYQNDHMTLAADPAVLKTDKHGRTFSERKMRTFSEEIPSDAKKVVIYTSNPEQLVKLVNAIKEAGNPGHSFEIVVDPDLTEAEGGNQKFGWDGDGSDRIYKVMEEEVKELNKKSKSYSNRSFSERCETFSQKKITQDEESGKWFIEGVDIPFETEESAKIALATMVVKGEPSDLNPGIKELGE